MRALSLPPVQRFAPAAPVVLRVVVGVVMAVHGWQKLTEMGPAMFGETMVADLGLPAPVLLAWTITLVELVGGTLLIVGLVTRISAALLAVVLIGAAVLVQPDLGLIAPMGAMLPGAELDLALIAGAVGVFLLGPGKPSLDHAMGIETAVPTLRSDRARTRPEPVHA